MSALRGMIFDVDGVVADTEALNARASVLMFQQLYSADVQPEDFAPFVGTGDERYVQGVAEKYGVTIDTATAVECRRANFFALLQNEPLPAMPGVIDLVLAARDHPSWRLAIATSGNKDKQFPVITGTGLKLEWFDAIITGDDVTAKKPDPQIYQVTAKRLKVLAAQCVVFEDAPAGVTAAKAAGMACIAVTSSVPADQLAAADRVVASLAEVDLPSLLALLGV